MKDMLISLQSSLMTNLSSLIHKFTSDMRYMGDRVQYIKTKMDECTGTVNDLVDACMTQKDDTPWIKSKLGGLEDCSCHNNIKIRGIPESVPPAELPSYASTMFSMLLPELSPIELTIHRTLKPCHLVEAIPRDVLLRIPFY